MANWSEVLSSLENLQDNEKAKIMKVLNRFFIIIFLIIKVGYLKRFENRRNGGEPYT